MPEEKECNYKLVFSNLDDSSTVNTATTKDNVLQPDAGYVWEVVGMRLYAPAVGGGSSSGTHAFYLRQCSDTILHAQLIAAFDGTIDLNYTLFIAGSSELPDGSTAQGNLIHRFVASNTYPLQIDYQNSTDANQTNARLIRVLVKEYREAV